MEVETTILQNQEVSEVIVRVENEAEIVAFYTTESDPYEDLTQWIETHLPSHMRPFL